MSWISIATNVAPWQKSTSDPNVLNNIYAARDVLLPYMTEEALSGILGNMLYESYLNPQQGETGGGGYGLIQWTPKTSLTNYVSGDYTNGDIQCSFLLEDCNNLHGTRWINKHGYNYTFAEFCQLTNAALAARAFCWERERPNADSANIAQRVQFAEEIYDIIHQQPQPVDDWLVVILYQLFDKL